MLLGRNLDDIDAATIQSLIDVGATESVHLEFKSASYGNADADKKELLKDVSAFANTLGGHIVIGVDETDGVATVLTPLARNSVDGEILRLENIARAGIEPTIVGLRMRRMDVGDGSVIVIHVPSSFKPPHRVIYKNSNRYYARNSAGIHELSLEELRVLFGERRSIEERAEAFIRKRFLQVQGNDGAIQIPVSLGVLVMHLVPLPDFGAERRIEIPTLAAQQEHFLPIGDTAFTPRVNLDGYCVYRPGATCHGYTQIFRDGSVEATSCSMFRQRPNGHRYFPSVALPDKLRSALNNYMRGLRAMEVSPPILLQISAMEINGVRMSLNPVHFDEPPPYDREDIHLPSTIITEYDDTGNYEPVIAEQMDFLWNAFDFDRCFCFDNDGNWVGAAALD